MNQLKKNYTLVKAILNKEKSIKKVCDDVGITLTDTSPLAASYVCEVLAIIGTPPEGHTEGFNWDNFINDYYDIVWDMKDVDKTLKSWEKVIKPLEVNYEPKNNQKILKDFLKKEKELFQAIKKTNMQNTVFSSLIVDWNLAKVLFKQESEEFSNDLFKVVEQEGSEEGFLRKWANYGTNKTK